jgi:hypothetical protein
MQFHTRIVHCLALVFAGTAAPQASPTSAMPANHPRIAITVRVYESADLPPGLEQRALAEATTVMQSAFVDVRWHHCTGPNLPAACSAPGGSAELLLRVREGGRCEETPATLGHAFVVHGAAGVMATVHVDCITRLATLSKGDVGVLLGRVVAHELGHLMMRTSSHARRGLMRAIWTRPEVQRNLAADWSFTADDISAMSRAASD